MTLFAILNYKNLMKLSNGKTFGSCILLTTDPYLSNISQVHAKIAWIDLFIHVSTVNKQHLAILCVLNILNMVLN